MVDALLITLLVMALLAITLGYFITKHIDDL